MVDGVQLFYGVRLRLAHVNRQRQTNTLHQIVKTAEDWRLYQYLRKRSTSRPRALIEFIAARAAISTMRQ